MIAEKIDMQFDNVRLWKSLQPYTLQHPSVQRSRAIGGWALQSTNGSYTDGWSMDFCPYNGPSNRGPSWNPVTKKEIATPCIQDYRLPTEVNSPELNALLQFLEQKKLNPRRARIIKLTQNSECQWHQDGDDRFYQARLHIPLHTNSQCFFETQKGKIHMPVDGSFYFVHINQIHRVVNYGPEDRYHFVCHIWDQNKFTLHHRYEPSLYDTESFHPES